MNTTRDSRAFADDIVTAIAAAFTTQRDLAERALAQLRDDDLLRTLDDDANSVAVLMKHVGGNLHSRWTDPFTTDGEKPDRNRDGEFDGVAAGDAHDAWNRGWHTLERFLAGLSPDDFSRGLLIRGEPLSLLAALHRSLAHTSQHVGQLILLARHWRGTEWRTLSIPRAPRNG